jgi:16S rRNA (cytosine967-C5)-methyltransferase
LARLLDHTADAVQAVRAGRSLNDVLPKVPPDARAGTQALSFHVLRWLGSALGARSLLAPKTPPPAVDALLLTSLALLWPRAESPYAPHTLVDQAVTAARQRHKGSASFVNAVLRRFLREQDEIVSTAEQDPVAVHNHPVWWAQRLGGDWPDRWQELLAANNRRPPMTLRVNARRGDAVGYLERLRNAGFEGTVFGTHTIVLAAPCPVSQLPGFEDGDVSVQDAGAQMAALLLVPGLPPNAHVLDACAAPGGKTAHLLELADLDLLALDADPARLKRVDDTLRRLSQQARTKAADAAAPDTWWDGRPFDAILLDAPCTASGIVRRHPDVRWLRRPGDIPALAQTQARLLDALWPTLEKGGRLLYCTCSVFKAEGQHQIDAFLQRKPDASLAKQPESPGHLLPLPDNGSEARSPIVGAFPDGFYYALLEKT